MTLVLLDFDHIKSFIYAAPMLRTIRGSSSILAAFNNFDQVKQRAQNAGGSLIYAGGGSVLAHFPSQQIAAAFVTREKAKLEQLTRGGATFTAVIVDSSGQPDPGAAVLQAQRNLLQAKARRVHIGHLSHHGLFKPCQACASQPAVMRNALRNLLVCATCEERIRRGDPRINRNGFPDSNPQQHSNRQRLLKRFLAQAGEAWNEVKAAEDLETLAAVSGNYIGLIQADGNAMGERLRYLAEDDLTLFTEFSAQCRQATEKALYQALFNAYPQPSRVRGETLLPFELVIVGGDDVILITTADRAIQVAVDLCDRFTDSMQDWANHHQHPKLAVAMSAGVVFARSNYPVVLLDELAGQLLKSAKLRSRQLGKEALTPTIDFMAVKASTVGELQALRKQIYRQQGIQRTQRPYTTRDLRRLFGVLQWMKHPEDKVQPFPRSKLHDLYAIPFKSLDQARLEYRSFLGRLAQSEHKPQREMLQKLVKMGGMTDGPWRYVRAGDPEALPDVTWDTNLLDAVELYDFVPR